MSYLEGLNHPSNEASPVMHKHTKLTPSLRREVYKAWLDSKRNVLRLAKSYHVDRNVIYRIIKRGRLGDFTVHDSTNHRFRTIEYGLKRLSKTEERIQRRLDYLSLRRSQHYEKNVPGEMIHGDTRCLPTIKLPGQKQKRIEVLFVAIDDSTRFLTADILPDKTMWSSSLFLENALLRLPFPVYCHYSDNGGEYKGNTGHAFVAACARSGIIQRFTKPYHPWTNGKAERVIKTIVYEWLKKNHFNSYEERRASLYAFVDYYNHERVHMSLNGQTPFQKLSSYYEKCDNA